MDLLDSVIGEFDDGLMSATDSEFAGPTKSYSNNVNGSRSNKHHNGSRSNNIQSRSRMEEEANDRIEAEIRRRPPPKLRDR